MRMPCVATKAMKLSTKAMKLSTKAMCCNQGYEADMCFNKSAIEVYEWY
jgi:hypothetical protein